MSKKQDNQFGLLSVGVSLPKERISVEDLALQNGYEPQFLKQALSLVEKPIARGEDEHPSDLAEKAVKNAIEALGISKDDIGLLIYAGLSRDFLPAWNVSTELLHRLEIKNALPFDMTLGCVAPLVAMEIAKNRSEDSRPPYSIIVTAERWTHTLSSAKQTPTAVLGHADGAAACVVGPGSSHLLSVDPFYKIVPEYNDSIVIPAGGTKLPPSHETIDKNMHVRQSKNWDFPQLVKRYVAAYKEVITGALGRLDRDFSDITLLLTNQVPPLIRFQLLKGLKFDEDITVNTFPYSGHIGGADTLISLDQAVRQNKLKKGTTVFVASTFSAFGSVAIDSLKSGGLAILDENNELSKVA